MSPIKFYIYGVPDGFDMLSGTLDDKSYFEMFYDTSKKGTELKVNRNINGETIYSYMVYDLVSCKGRPGAFFGMSVAFSNYEYCNDVRSLSDLFDGVLKNVILKKGILMASGENGVVYFKVSRFKEQADECNNVGEIIRFNIQEKLAHTIVSYDNTFTRNKEGRILTVPFNLPNTDFLHVFKDYVWVSLSSEKGTVLPPPPGSSSSSGSGGNNDEQLSPDYLAALRKKTGTYKDLIIEAFKGNCTKDAISTALNEVSSHLNVLREFARRQAGVSELKQDYESIYVELEDRWKNMIESTGSGSGSGSGPYPPTQPAGAWERFLKSKFSKVAVILVLVAGLGYGAYKLGSKITSAFSNNKANVENLDSIDKGRQGKRQGVKPRGDKTYKFSEDSLFVFIDNKDFIGADAYICRFEKNKVDERRKSLSLCIDNWFLSTKNNTSQTRESLESLKSKINSEFPEYVKKDYIARVDDELSKIQKADTPSGDARTDSVPPKQTSPKTPVLALYKADVNYQSASVVSGSPVDCRVGDCFVIKKSTGTISSFTVTLNGRLETAEHKRKGFINIKAIGAGSVSITVDGQTFDFKIKR